MSTEGLLFGLIIAIATCLLVLSPLLIRRPVQTAHQTQEQHKLLTQYEVVLTSIRDLEMDYHSGKMPEDDYHAERAEWVARGTSLLQQIDELTGQNPPETAPSTKIDDEAARIDAEIEALIASAREHQGQTV